MESEVSIWNVSEILSCDKTYAIIILNEGLHDADLLQIKALWNFASVCICVDGGTNGFHKMLYNAGTNSKPNVQLPHIICGDFDSIDPSLLDFYGELGTEIIKTPDQDATDFTKSLGCLKDYLDKRKLQLDHVKVIGGITSLRFDHVIAHINTLHKALSILPFPLILIAGKSVLWLLKKGKHRINVPDRIKYDPKSLWCSLSPFSGPTMVTTTGFKWNLDNTLCEFGGMVSTSNTYALEEKDLEICCSKPLLWTMGWNWNPSQNGD